MSCCAKCFSQRQWEQITRAVSSYIGSTHRDSFFFFPLHFLHLLIHLLFYDIWLPVAAVIVFLLSVHFESRVYAQVVIVHSYVWVCLHDVPFSHTHTHMGIPSRPLLVWSKVHGQTYHAHLLNAPAGIVHSLTDHILPEFIFLIAYEWLQWVAIKSFKSILNATRGERREMMEEEEEKKKTAKILFTSKTIWNWNKRKTNLMHSDQATGAGKAYVSGIKCLGVGLRTTYTRPE